MPTVLDDIDVQGQFTNTYPFTLSSLAAIDYVTRGSDGKINGGGFTFTSSRVPVGATMGWQIHNRLSRQPNCRHRLNLPSSQSPRRRQSLAVCTGVTPFDGQTAGGVPDGRGWISAIRVSAVQKGRAKTFNVSALSAVNATLARP